MKYAALSNRKQIFLLVTFFILIFDALFVWSNYKAAKDTLHENLSQRGEQLQDSYQIALAQLSQFMLQTATYIANDPVVAQRFYEGKKAVAEEGGGAGGERADRLRKQLYNTVSSGWQALRQDYKVRQLHFHLPLDTSFLRVHKPEKFGDDLSAIRHSVVAVNSKQVKSSGFESGRVYAGIRGVVPVYFNNIETGEKVHVGALEAGTSFNLMLQDLQKALSADFAVLMTMEHARQTMWPDFLKSYLKTKTEIQDFLLEAATNEQQVKAILAQDSAQKLLYSSDTQLITVDGMPRAVSSFPLRDYLGSVDSDRDDIGRIVVWTSAEKEVAEFEENTRTNLFIAIIGFLVIESLLFWAIKMESKLELHKEIALRDGLTGIFNRRAFDKRISEEFYRAKRHDEALSVILCDIDNFKSYNDHYGHIAGDLCLQSVANALTKNLKRSGDFLARYGGEEFVIVLPSTDEQHAFSIAEQLRAQVESQKLEHLQSSTGNIVSISCGVATSKSADYAAGMEPGALLNQADNALYEAKRKGRNRVCTARHSGQ